MLWFILVAFRNFLPNKRYYILVSLSFIVVTIASVLVCLVWGYGTRVTLSPVASFVSSSLMDRCLYRSENPYINGVVAFSLFTLLLFSPVPAVSGHSAVVCMPLVTFLSEPVFDREFSSVDSALEVGVVFSVTIVVYVSSLSVGSIANSVVSVLSPTRFGFPVPFNPLIPVGPLTSPSIILPSHLGWLDNRNEDQRTASQKGATKNNNQEMAKKTTSLILILLYFVAWSLAFTSTDEWLDEDRNRNKQKLWLGYCKSRCLLKGQIIDSTL